MIFTIKVLECGCKVQKRTFEPIANITHWIDYCCKHKAAPELLKALKGIIIAHNLSLWKTTNDTDDSVIESLNQIINKAEGK